MNQKSLDKTNLPIELQNEVIEDFRKNYISNEPKNINEETGQPYIHYWKTEEIEQFLLQSIDKAYKTGENNGLSIGWKLAWERIRNLLNPIYKNTREKYPNLQSLSKEK